MAKNNLIEVALANLEDRHIIYKHRHMVYADELMQHSPNKASIIQDHLDDFNVYLVAKINSEIVGFISITPPDKNLYSIDKYFPREEIPFEIDENTYEIRILTVLKPFRGKPFSVALMWAAFRWIQSLGGKTIMALGRSEVLDMYLRLGLTKTKKEVTSGKVTFTLIHRKVEELNTFIEQNYKIFLIKIKNQFAWKLGIDFFKPSPCYHGGAFFEAVGTEFEDLNKRKNIINADVLDAWFDPAPQLIKELQNHLAWICKTSPPTDCSGMAKGIAFASPQWLDRISSIIMNFN